MKLVGKAIDYFIFGKLKHISRFSMVGICNTLVDFIVFTLCTGFIGFNYTGSQILGYSCGIANSFVFNKKWTFDDAGSDKKTFQELFQFLVVNIVTLCITILVMDYLVASLNINVYAAKIFVTILAQATNFIAYRMWVFN